MRPSLSFGALLVAVSFGAHASTVNFTGTVTEATGLYGSVAVGSNVSGIFSIDYDAADPRESFGLPGSGSWVSQADGGPGYGLPPLTALVFSATFSVAGFNYASPPPGDGFTRTSRILTLVGGLSAKDEIRATAESITVLSFFVVSQSENPWTSNGLPVLPADATSAASFGTSGSGLTWTITSLSPVPLPSAIWLLLSGVAGLVGLARSYASN
jgi:hypothetical protein